MDAGVQKKKYIISKRDPPFEFYEGEKRKSWRSTPCYSLLKRSRLSQNSKKGGERIDRKKEKPIKNGLQPITALRTEEHGQFVLVQHRSTWMFCTRRFEYIEKMKRKDGRRRRLKFLFHREKTYRWNACLDHAPSVRDDDQPQWTPPRARAFVRVHPLYLAGVR